jgi:putative tryptophan/tyrosine transport system substrate-binding protein
MKRREFITLLGGVAAWPFAARVSAACIWPLAAHAQQAERVRRIGAVLALSEQDAEIQARIAAFRKELERLGWREGRNLHVEYRWAAADPNLKRTYVAELIAQKPDLIFAAPTSMAVAVHHETRSIPIVFAQVADPVAEGLVNSIAHPGGNSTGFSHFEFGIGAKWLEVLKEIAPNVTRVAVMYDPANSASTGYLPLMETAARALALEIIPSPARDDTEIEGVMNALASEPNGGVILIPSPLMGASHRLIISLANRHRLPSIFSFRYYPADGGLASYGVDLVDLYRHAAGYVDRVLRGERPADLPVQGPTRYELVINNKTAKALSLDMPPTLLARADEVIE